PGVRSASAAWWLPLSGSEITLNFDIEERPLPRGNQPLAQVNVVGLNYFKTMGVRLVQGRDFTETDDINAPPVLIVSQEFVREFFPNEDPIGKRITPAGSVTPGDPPARQIVG